MELRILGQESLAHFGSCGWFLDPGFAQPGFHQTPCAVELLFGYKCWSGQTTREQYAIHWTWMFLESFEVVW